MYEMSEQPGPVKITHQWITELEQESKLVAERSRIQRIDEKLQEHLINGITLV